MASPKLKNLYRSCTATSYACMIFSFPASADTSISNVDIPADGNLCQGIDTFEPVSRIDEYLGPAACCFYDSILSCCGFQCTTAGSSHRDHSATIFLCVIDQFCLIFLDNIEFRMHMMFLYIIHFNRTESSKTYMKGDMCDVHTHLFYLLQKFRCKMQSGSGCGRRSFVFCIYGLIAVLIL